jgi:hypothetical protein
MLNNPCGLLVTQVYLKNVHHMQGDNKIVGSTWPLPMKLHYYTTCCTGTTQLLPSNTSKHNFKQVLLSCAFALQHKAPPLFLFLREKASLHFINYFLIEIPVGITLRNGWLTKRVILNKNLNVICSGKSLEIYTQVSTRSCIRNIRIYIYM